MRITVVYCAPGIEDVSELSLPRGSTVADALKAAHICTRRPELKMPLDTGIWGRRCAADTLLEDRDRVEIYRPLSVDPKQARRARALLRRKQKAGS